jgi:DegV family protein with EDD domain
MEIVMRDYIITTTSTADLPIEFRKEHNIDITSLTFTIDGKDYKEEEMPYKEFYDGMRNGGTLPKTSACNVMDAVEMFEKHVKEGYNILHISFSSGLSSTYGNECIAAKEVMDNYPDVKIIVVDSLCASIGQGLLVYYMVRNRERGMTLEENAEWAENNKLHVCHQFTVDDLHHLHRGGRVSKTVAVIGTLVNVKPVLHVDNEGKLIPLRNVRGRKKSLSTLVDNMLEQIDGYDNEIIYIGHGDCIEDAEYVSRLVTEKTGITNIVIGYVGTVIGSHSGPGTLALFFMGKER